MINNLTSENKEMASNISFINASSPPEELSIDDLEYDIVYCINREIDNPIYYILVTDGADDYLVNLMDMETAMLPIDKIHSDVKFYKCKSVTISIDR